jgi:hypothetical protein
MRGVAIAALTGLAGGGWLVGARYAAYSSDCAMSSDCARFGLCHASWAQAMRGEPGECIARDASDCAEPCRVWGRCEHANDRCGAASDEHCRQSVRCRELGECDIVRAGVQWRATTGSCAKAWR